MILISFSLALIAIVFGAKLLAQSQKDNLAALYKYLSWFVIVVGFLVLLCDGARGLLAVSHRGSIMREKYMMMNRGDGMMGGGQMWMMRHHGMMNCDNNCCGGMMNCNDGANCSDGMMSCPDEGKGSCTHSMGAGSCGMMGNMKCKMDSAKTKK